MHALVGHEIRYEATFLRDLKHLEPTEFERVRAFVFEEFYTISHLQDLPDFRQIESSGIFYRFTFDRYLVSLEITGQLVKFLRVLPMPEI
jgi:mRNA-degrading endonuclease RelE of RelBE toxin-antitoxin system